MTETPVIELKDVKKHYKMDEVTLKILNDIDLKIYRGEKLGIRGASGSGKSTLLNIIGLLDRPTHGRVLIDGIDTAHLDDNQLARIRGHKIGFVFQFFYLIPSISALDNVMLPMTFDGKKDEEKAKNLLRQVGLEHRMNSKPSQLSGGERQRVAIARALANDPEIVLADEPTGNLDSKSGDEVLHILIELNKSRNLTLVVVTHDEHVTSHMDRVIHIKDGLIIKTTGENKHGGE